MIRLLTTARAGFSIHVAARRSRTRAPRAFATLAHRRPVLGCHFVIAHTQSRATGAVTRVKVPRATSHSRHATQCRERKSIEGHATSERPPEYGPEVFYVTSTVVDLTP